MPTNTSPHYMRNYARKHPEKWNNPKEREKKRKRSKSRYAMIKKYGKAKLRNLDVNHKKPLRSGGSNNMSNLEILPPSINRADNGHRKKRK